MSTEIIRADARRRIDRIKSHVRAAWADIVEAWRARDWLTLGYASWDEMCETEFAGARIALPITERQALVADLRGEGMSTRAIAGVTGVDHSTVTRDLTAIATGSTGADAPVDPRTPVPAASITGLDGKSRPATRPHVEDKAPRRRADGLSGEVLHLSTHDGRMVPYPKPFGKPTFNPTNDAISWAAWSWNPVTGCLTGCDYCYARELALKPSYAAAYPVGFTPLLHHERLSAPANTPIPAEAANDPRKGRVFVGSMTDLFGEWVPQGWIDRVYEAMAAAPDWRYLCLTKHPKRYLRAGVPPRLWAGTSVDTQARVRIAEEAMRDVPAAVRWLSVEPMEEHLTFRDLSWCDWVVIGSRTATVQPTGAVPAFAPPFEWVTDLVVQARDAGAAVYLKPNLLGQVGPQSPGMKLIQEMPAER